MQRSFNRELHEFRPVKITLGYNKYAQGSVLIEFGETKVLCTAFVIEKVPPFIKEQKLNHGWLTAEYGMLPSATQTRFEREGRRGQVSGRTQEIQRLIGRALRTCVDLNLMPNYTIQIDCDVIQADGGTRTTSINGAVIALYQACQYMVNQGLVTQNPFREFVAAISCGVKESQVLCDLDYAEDSTIGCDCNVVMSESGQLIEFQISSEKEPCTKEQLDTIYDVASHAIQAVNKQQKQVLGLE